MSENQTSEAAEKPAQNNDDIEFPPFAEPTDDDFEDDIIEEERTYYKSLFPDINTIKSFKLHCTACDRHIGCCPRNEQKLRCHPMLRTLICNTCYTFYNSGEFEKGDDGSELYCRWCGQGGQVYCCSSCPHVFCAKCVKRNFGPSMIKEIESNDDWKCFKCNNINPRLWELRATCWALLRYCTVRNKTIYLTKDPELKEKYLKQCSYDVSVCCKKRREKKTDKKKEEKKENDNVAKKGVTIAGALPKTQPTIQVKKFASMKHEDTPNKERKAQKRPLSPKTKSMAITNPIAIGPAPAKHKVYPSTYCNPPKKVRVFNPTMFNPTTPRYTSPNSVFPRAQRLPKLPTGVSIIRPIQQIQFNGFNNFNAFPTSNFVNDNINLSLDNLTQGLDMANVIMDNTSQDDDVVCTPDFPMEPLCEVTEESMDDDVQCITPSPATSTRADLPPLVARNTAPIPSLATTSSGSKTSATLPHPTLPDLSPENIVQMTENDVSVNSVTGGLKFRVDPQTLSSNKMYRLPDGRIFAINPNPNMPGGYSASIVSATTSGPGKNTPKGAIYAAKLTAMSSSQATPPPLRSTNKPRPKRNEQKNSTKPAPMVTNSFRKCDLNVPVEWFRYNLIDAVDALEYSMSRMNKLKREATTMYLRTRTVDEMSDLSKTVENVLNTSISRFKEINENLDKGLKDYKRKKTNGYSEDDDDDVEIVQEEEEDGPIFIDENSLDSQTNEMESRGDPTDFNRSDLNDKSDKVNPKSSQTPVNKSKTRDQLINNSDKSNKTKDNNEAIVNYEDEDDLLADPECSNVATVDSEDNNEKTIETEDNNKTTVDNVDEDYLLADPESSNAATADREFNNEKTVESEDNNKTTGDNEVNDETTVDNDVNKETSVDNEVNDETTVDNDVNKETSVDNEVNDETTIDNDDNDKMSVDNAINDETTVDNEDNDKTTVDNDTTVDIKDDSLACSEDINELDHVDEETNDKETEEKENEYKDLKNDVTLDISEEDDRMDDVANGDIKSYKESDDGVDISGEI